jgi:dTDP-4-amino-4,6-dideoxygalactose transaminase
MTELLFADPHGSFVGSRAELVEAFEAVLDSGRYILGEQVESFERDWAAFCATAHAVGVSSGTDALALGLRAAGIGPGDEVLVPAMTAVATWMAVSQIGAIPVGVDIEPVRNGMDPGLARSALSPRTRALVAVHLFGQPADVAALADVARGAGIPLIEDAAQAHGARLDGRAVGSLGALAAFSFYPTKNLGAIGDAGAVTTSDPELADRVRVLREYGWRTREDAELKGVNARLDELQAALLGVMLARLEDALTRRRTIAHAYLGGLAGLEGLELPASVPGSEPSWHLFVIRHSNRDALAAGLAEAGVGTAVHYGTAPPLNSAFRADGFRRGAFPVAERHATRALSLPMHPGLSDADVSRVIQAVHTIARSI